MRLCGAPAPAPAACLCLVSPCLSAVCRLLRLSACADCNTGCVFALCLALRGCGGVRGALWLCAVWLWLCGAACCWAA